MRLGWMALAVLVASSVRAAHASVARVAVLVEPGMVAYGGTPALPAYRMVSALRRIGVPCEAITTAQAADGRTLTTQRFTVLVVPYGNAFPLDAYSGIRAFHAAGGCLVTTGVPFTHPCEKRGDRWVDLGHDGSRMGHTDGGIGTGGFAGPDARRGAGVTAAPGNPIGVRTGMLPNRAINPQWLDVSSLASDDQVVPVVLAGGSRPASALIRHRCAAFRNARDVWVGQVASGITEQDRYAALQLVARGVLWCLAEKGQLPPAGLRARIAKLDRMPKPGPLPANLPYKDSPRPWGDTFVPRSPAPARRLQVVDMATLSRDERIAVACLQGLTSRKQPVIWLNNDTNTQFWLDWHRQKGYIDGYERVGDWRTLFRRYASVYRGAVVPDPKLFRGDVLAANVAACEDLIVATPELAARLGIPVKRDLRGRFPTYAEGLRWLWRTYRGRLNHHLSMFVHPALLQTGSFAYALQWRALMFWIAGPVDDAEPGADMVAETRAVAEILAQMPPNTAVLGYPYAGEGVGIGEVDGVGLISRYAKSLIASDFLPNCSVMSGVRIAELRQPTQPPAPPLERDKVYVALVMSDGDNLCLWHNLFRARFENRAFGTFPLAFGMGPAIIELEPAVAQWFFEHASPTTEFIADVSGVAYMQPSKYATAYAQRDRVYSGFLRWTARLMRQTGMRSVRTVEGDDAEVARFAKALPFCHSMFPDMGRYSGRERIANLTYSLPDGTPVFRAVTSWRYGKEGFYREVREQVGSQRPEFVNGFAHVWTLGMEDLARIYAQRLPDVVFVTPTQLATLYRQARQRGWTR